MKVSDNVIKLIRDFERNGDVELKRSLDKYEKAIESEITVDLYQNQFDALVSFCFDIGLQKFKTCNVVKRINSGENPNTVAAEELPKWNKDNGKVLEKLNRRRSAEVELFCSEPPTIKVGLVDITSRYNTWFKKRLVSSVELHRDEKAHIYRGRTIRNCSVIDRKDNHSFVDLGVGLGKWWIYDGHWDGLVTKNTIHPYAVTGDLHYLRTFPYFYQPDTGPDGWRKSLASCVAMCLRYLDTPGINDEADYLKILNKHGSPIYCRAHAKTLAEIGVSAKFTKSADEDDVKKQIDSGLPVIAGILHDGDISDVTGGGHFVVLTGYGRDYWLVQDPYGEIDLVNGGWAATGAVAGRNIQYSFENMNPRFFVGGNGSGWCWQDFKRLK